MRGRRISQWLAASENEGEVTYKLGDHLGTSVGGMSAAPVSLQDHHAIPLVDPGVLGDLGTSLDSNALAVRFAGDYIALWSRRRRRLATALARGDFPASIDAVLSLRTASVMVGGLRLAVLARQVEDAIHRGDFAAAEQIMAGVAVCGADTVAALALVRSGMHA